jgi:hypothetical protein
MDTITPAVTPLRQRMIDDMRMRKLEPKTQEAYIRAVRKLAAYLKRSPDTGHGGGSAQFPAAPGRHRHLAHHAQRHAHRA